MRKVLGVAAVAMALTVVGSAAIADGKEKGAKKVIEYRQAAMTLVGANFKPMGAMVKGEMEWDQDKFQSMAKDLASVATLNHMRGYPEGSEKGKTKAKKEIWENMDDFKAKMAGFSEAAAELSKVADGGDQAAIKEQFGKTGKSCKGCHKEYKSKKYQSK